MGRGRGGPRQQGKVVWPGFSNAPLPRHVVKVGRNDPCPCESGKKYKDCHESEGSAYLDRLARDDEKQKLAAYREELKQRGVPWWKRLFYRS